ncbi:hypothetical protein ACJ72_00647 [Emergomyces africanus]|uniref:C2H2-type domain-containing protein n=1 Tax=Emergomyces africanus TaxID=1955775 RepID=A0A1B7P7U3_9EURO|nr:hypothetical protein ACJ72_00647 [Emergomyces africanus]
MSTGKTRPRLDSMPTSSISTSKRYHATVNDDVIASSDNVSPRRILPFDHGSQLNEEDTLILQEQPQDVRRPGISDGSAVCSIVNTVSMANQDKQYQMLVTEAFWGAVTFEDPQASLEFDEIYKVQPQQDHRLLNFVGKIPNFSRPLYPLPSVPGMENAPSTTPTAGTKPKLQEINKQIPLVARETETVVVTLDSESHALGHLPKDASSSTSDPYMAIPDRDEDHHKLIQPCSDHFLPVTAYPSGSPQIRNDYPHSPVNMSLHLSPENPKNPPPPEPPPLERRTHSSASRMLRKLRDHLCTPHSETPSRNSNNSFTQHQSQSHEKQSAGSGLISSWSANLKHALNYRPQRQKDESKHESTSQGQKADTNSRSGRSPPKKTSRTGMDTRDRSLSIRSKVDTRETNRSTSKPSASILSNTSSYSEKPRLPLKVSTTPLTALEEFQCTFCLLQCESKADWLIHEQRFHLEDLENFSRSYKIKDGQRDEISSLGSKLSRGKSCRRLLTKSQPQSASSSSPSHHSTQSTGTSVSANHLSEWQQANIFWNCGFCNELLRSWEDRQAHLAGHFNNGQTMRMWDPMKSPFPWRKGSAGPVDAPPHWDLPSLLALQRPTLQDSINQIAASHNPPEKTNQLDTCKSCHVPHPSLEHFDLWHQPRDTFTCPRITDFTNLAEFFEEDQDESGEMIVDWCNACDERLDRRDYLDRDIRMQHLWDFHGFGDCMGWDNCLDEGQFVLHLANAHGVNIEFIKGFVRRCRKVGDAPASMAMGGGS